MSVNTCVCCSGKNFEKCCAPFLNGASFAKTPKQLMRSRYSAFALGGYGEYLLQTWSPNAAAQHTAAELSAKSANWSNLEIVQHAQTGNQGYVEFKATYIEANGQIALHHEQSTFTRVNGRWLYLNGDVLS